jgi:A/G-specific adenine glycosylase
MGMKRHQNIAHEILNWYAKNARDLPWRKTEDPYNIWVSEVMLQQTQVSRVIDYYARFLNKFPTVHHLAKAEWDDFLPVWRGLGFYSRGKNMLRTGKIVAEKYAGVFPQSKKELESLPGIGPYTASAILSFAHKKPEPAIDTNLLRVFQRVFGCTEKGVLPRSKELFLSVKDGHRLNHAIMDIGSQICKGRKVLCEQCPLQAECHFLQSGKKEEWEQSLVAGKIGVQKKSNKIPMEVAAACIHKNGKYLIAKRPKEKGGNWEFPGGKREKGEDWRHCLKREIHEELGVEISARPHFFEETWEEGDYFWRLRFSRCQILKGEPKAHEHAQLKWVKPEELLEYDFPVANRNALEQLMKMKMM